MAALCFLVIITILVLAFFTSVSREHTTTKIYSSGVNAKFLSDAAVNLVMGQITAATQGTQPGVQGRFTWASQPGMIRTYSDQDQDTDVADNCYKLYSSSAMIVPGSTIAAQASQDVPAGWNTEPALYTDLNAPVVDSTGATNFPIVDGNGLTTMTVNGAQVLTYDTNGDGVPDVEGFSIPLSSVPTYSAGSPVSATNNPAPMPVQWLYILKDGTITSPDSVSDKTVHWTGTSTNKAPTPSNPIVGRMAFWTDDETSKLNINTASEGDFYGPSYTISPTDNQFANGSKEYGLYMAPPATGEYNRYPGHPATTCLSVALGTWVGNLNTSTSPAAPTAYTSSSNDAAYVQSLQQYLQFPGGLLPQYNFGGSQAGTINIQDKNYNIVAANTSRLFSSVDELIFSPSRSAFPGLNKNIVQKMKFFLTASSRAPELTPFNTPKVSVWPQWMNAQDRSASAGTALGSLSSNYASLDSYFAADVTYSRVLAACSSFGTNASSPSGKNEYFFQRYARGTGTNSSNSKVGSWADTYSDWDKVPRNQQLANYLCTMGAQSIPGYGAALSGNKYTARNFSQIVLETLDYIRSNVDRMGYLTADDNVVDPVLTDGSGVNIRVFNAYIPPLLVTGGTLLPGMTDSNDVLKGFGFYPIPVQFGFLQGGNTATDQQAVLGVELFLPADPTPAPLYPVGATIENAKQIQFANPLTTDPWYQFLWKYAELQGGGESNMARFFWTWAAHNTYTNAPFFPVQGTSPNQTITMGSGPITLDLWPSVTSTAIPTTGPATPPGRASPYVQKITLEFPTVSQIPMPTTPFNNLSGSVGVPPNLNVTAPPTPPAGSPPTPMPTPIAVRSMVLNALNNTYAGDWRVLGALYNIDDSVNEAKGNVAAQIFVPSPNYTTTASESHSFRMRGFEDVGNNQQQPYSLTSDPTATAPTTSTSGSLISALDGAKYSDSNAPLVAQSQTAALNSLGYPGDWDTGPDENPDGPYINALKQTPVDLDFYGSTVNGDESSAFSPNSLIASPVQFGSLPTGVYPQSWSAANPRAEPWQTLLFCPNPAARVDVSSTTLAKDLPGSAGVEHRGFLNPPDHLYLEFFTMPVVEPYAISEPFSTAGKVNLNYQIMPFTNIERSTAVRGVLKNLLLTAISGNDLTSPSGTHPTPKSEISYKYNIQRQGNSNGPPLPYPNEVHYNVDRDATLAGWEKYYFNNGYIFRYPSEICDLFLVPQRISGASYLGASPPTSYDDLVSWWSSKTDLSAMIGTGDNAREAPYNHLYPRLTTKSNSYRVHYRVQMLQKLMGSDATTWTEGQDRVVSESRGSSLIERYLDSNDPKLTADWDSATLSLDFTKSYVDLSSLYKFRIISMDKFTP